MEKTGLLYKDIEYDIDLTKISVELFSFVGESGLSAILFGGTALNRGFFKERQRLSKDLDIMTKERDLEAFANRISDHMKSLGYHVNMELAENESASEEDEEIYSIKLFLATENRNRVEIALYREDVSFDVAYIELHSLIEYLKYPYAYPVKVPAYSFEGLLSRKIYALYERRLYKDLYDARYGIELLKGKRKLQSSLSSITPSYKDVIRGIDKFTEDSILGRDEYEMLIQTRYRESLGSMLKYVRMKLNLIP